MMPKEIESRAEMIYSCQECKAMFLFAQDVMEHTKMFDHAVDELPLG
jgi:hypothetical protein